MSSYRGGRDGSYSDRRPERRHSSRERRGDRSPSPSRGRSYSDRYPQDRRSDDRYSGERPPSGRSSSDRYSNDRYPDDRYSSERRSSSRHPADRHSSSRYSTDRRRSRSRSRSRSPPPRPAFSPAAPQVPEHLAGVLPPSRRISESQRQFAREQDDWETAQLVRSGVAHRDKVDLDLDIDEREKVQITVRNLLPPFLDGQTAYTRQQKPVIPVRDSTSDLARLSRQGSALMQERRQQKERVDAQGKFWQVSGSAMGRVVGISEADDEELQRRRAQDSALSGRVLNVQTAPGSTGQGADSGSGTGGIGDAKAAAVSEFAQQKTIKQQREFLPVFSVRNDLMQVIRDHQVVIVVGETGSGKTTQLTQYLCEAGYANGGRMIGCTQPRRVAATSVAARVATEMGVKLGQEVGYSIRFEDRTDASTKIKYMTDGVLLRESLVDPDLSQYGAIVMDEAHERSLNTDVLLGILKRVVAGRRDLKLIITSATMNADKFSAFFGEVPCFFIPGRTFPVDIMFSKGPVEDYVETAVRQILDIHLGSPPGDILVFMTGQDDVETTCEVVLERLAQLEDPAPLNVLPIYSQLPEERQRLVFEGDGSVRKCIVATNIAETSLTVDGIVYVIDCGFYKLKTYDPRHGMDMLLMYPISQANANQRAGRAGRTQPGTCYRLYTENAYRHEMLESTVPEIQRTNLSNAVLLLKSLGVRDLLEFDFLDPPPQANILSSMYQLWTLGALDNLGELTPVGRAMSGFPLDPTLSKMLITSNELACTTEIATVVSMLSVPPVLMRPRGREEEADTAHERFSVPESDHLTLLYVFRLYESNRFSDAWCDKNFINPRSMRNAREVRDQLLDLMRKARMDMRSCGNDFDLVRKAICSAYFYHAAKMKSVEEYVNMRTGKPCRLERSSGIFRLGSPPDYIVYHELVMTSREYMRGVTVVEPSWLATLGPMFFKVVTMENRLRSNYRDHLEAESMERELERAREAARIRQEAEQERRRRQMANTDVVTVGRRAPDAAGPRQTTSLAGNLASRLAVRAALSGKTSNAPAGSASAGPASGVSTGSAAVSTAGARRTLPPPPKPRRRMGI